MSVSSVLGLPCCLDAKRICTSLGLVPTWYGIVLGVLHDLPPLGTMALLGIVWKIQPPHADMIPKFENPFDGATCVPSILAVLGWFNDCAAIIVRSQLLCRANCMLGILKELNQYQYSE